MDIFFLTLQQMLMMFTLMLVGFLLRKKCLLPEDSHVGMSKMETYVITPALTLSTQITKCTVETLTGNSVLILYGLVIVMCAIALAYPLSKLFVKNYKQSQELTYQRSIYKYALTFGNYGFVGNFIILGVWGSDMFYKYSLFVFFVGILCSSWGVYILIPKDQEASLWKNLKKGILTPPMIALVIGMLLGLLNCKQYIPAFLLDAFEKTGACQGPIAMLLAGFVIGGYDFKEMFGNIKVYIASLLRLIVIPAALMLVLKLIGAEDEIMTLVLIAFATPLGLNTIVYPAAYGGDTKTGASMTMVSQTLSVITIPLMYLVFIVLL